VVDDGLYPGAVAAALATFEYPGELVQLAGGLGDGLVEPAGLFGVQVRGVGQQYPALRAEGVDAGLVGGEPTVASRVDAGSVPGWQREQLGVLRRWQGADEVQADVGEVGEVRGRVLPGVEDDRETRLLRTSPTGSRSEQ
jgi:hypothetical protein